MGVPLFSTLSVAMLGGMVWVGATVLEAGERAERATDERIAQGIAQGIAERIAAERRTAARDMRDRRAREAARIRVIGERCAKDRERAWKRAARGGRWREPRSCERHADARDRMRDRMRDRTRDDMREAVVARGGAR